jgi:zinc transport system permease protein
MDDFLIRALLAGLGVALAAGPLGCFVVWRRMAYFGDALAHSALLGVALAVALQVNLMLGVVAFSLALGAALALLERQQLLATDTLLGILAHGGLALGLIALSLIGPGRVDLLSLLFGDILAVTRADLGLIGLLILVVALALARLWRPLLAATVQAELAEVEGVRVGAVRLAFTLLLAAAVGVGMKVVGVMLIVSLLIVPAAAARRLARTPEQMAAGASGLGMTAVALGLWASLQWDVPSGPAIVAAAILLFAALAALPARGG